LLSIYAFAVFPTFGFAAYELKCLIDAIICAANPLSPEITHRQSKSTAFKFDSLNC